MPNETQKEQSSFTNGFKFAAGVIICLIIFFFFFRPSIVIGPLDSEGNVIVPKGTAEDIIYSSTPIKEYDSSQKRCPNSCDDGDICTEDKCSILTDYKCAHTKLVPCCGDGICEENENAEECNKDCKGPEVILNSYELKETIGELPEEIKSNYFYKEGDEEYKKSIESNYIYSPKEGNKFLILDLTIINQDQNTFSWSNIQLKDDEGYNYQESVYSVIVDKYLQHNELNLGEKVSGNVLFEIPENIKDFELRIDYYSGDFLSFATYTKDIGIE